MKDFAAEIRAHLDVEQFLSQAQLMLDLPETNMEEILDRMLHNLLDRDETPAAFIEARKALFTHRSGPTCFILAVCLLSLSCGRFVREWERKNSYLFSFGNGIDYSETESSVQECYFA